MSRIFLTSAACLTVCLCLAGSSLGQETPAADRGLFYPSRLQTITGGYLHPTRFGGAPVCSGCHTEIFYQWRGSMHSNAHFDPLYLGLSGMASRETNGLTARFCSGCHSPLGVAGGEVPPVGNPLMSRVGTEGITCDFCHTVDKGLDVGNLPALLDPGPKKRGPRKDSQSPFHETAYLELSAQAEFCGLCHDVSHPLNNLPIERTYTEWKEGPYNTTDPGQRVYCQDCHMRQRPGVPATGLTSRDNFRGKSASMGPWREHVYSHVFVGGNAALTGRFGARDHRAMAIERLKQAATMEIVDPSASAGDFAYTVRVTNAGAGHYLPTGLTEVRQMWVETEVRLPGGEVLFRAGSPDEKGELPPDTPIYHTVLGDASGKPTGKVWEATQVLSDRRIPPGKQNDIPYRAKTDRRWKGKVTVTARLLYRSYPPSLAAALTESGLLPAEIVEMGSIERPVELN